MNTKHEFCPGCGAQVYPEETQCPFCGRSLRNRALIPVVIGLAGTAVALVSGALVWWVLSSPAPVRSAGSAPAESASSAPTPAISASPAAPSTPASPAVAEAPAPVAPAAPPVAPPPSSETSAFAPPPTPERPALARPEPAAAPAVPSVAAVPPSLAAPLTRSTDTPADAESRRAFAKSKQESFAQNGLDLKVTTSGPEDTTLTITFNFSAKTAAELIIAGPFPKQCEQRGFKDILFEDPTGTTWVYDVATQKMTLK